MYEVIVKDYFSAAHRIRNYEGKCENLHGHNWRVEVRLEGERLDKAGMLYDFTKLKAGLKRILNGLDHKYLNDMKYFAKFNPTSENIARFVYEELERKTGKADYRLKNVTVWESENNNATYTG